MKFSNDVGLIDSLRYDLRGPCSECPFRLNAPWHEGVVKDLQLFYGRSERGDLVFTCHKTDPRSDSPIGQKYKGPVQHCGGLLLMMAKDASFCGRHQLQAMRSELWKPELMNFRQRVFKNFADMFTYYLKLWKVNKPEQWNRVVEQGERDRHDVRR